MGNIIKISDFKEVRENKLHNELLQDARKREALEIKLNDFFAFIKKGRALATPDEGEEGDFSLFTLSFRLVQLRSRTDELINLIKESIGLDWSDFDPRA